MGTIQRLLACLLIIGVFPLAGQASKVQFGAYEALSIEEEVIRGVKAGDDGRIWIMLNPKYREQEIKVRISQENMAGYRKWYTGEEDLISPAGQDKAANSWTDWVETKSPYVEYWMGGKMILHLKKTE